MKKRKKKTKTENAGKFCKPVKIFTTVAKFRNPGEKILQPLRKNFVAPCEISQNLLLNFMPKFNRP